MRWLAWCLMVVCAVLVGCEKPTETIPSVTPSSGTTDADDHGAAGHEHADEGHEHAEGEAHEGDDADANAEEAAEDTTGKEDSAAVNTGDSVRFVSNVSLKVPGMMCPYSCYPAVEKTLVGLPGVEGVQLAEQPEGTAEGEIKERVVELKVSDKFDPNAAIAALGKIDYESEVVN